MNAKPPTVLRRNTALLAALLLSSASHADSLPTINPTLGIAPGAGAGAASVTVTDQYNHVWILQGSSDLSTWTEIAPIKVFNGAFQQSVATAGPYEFFRAFYDPARQSIPDSTAAALRLPLTYYNYAAPALPPNFLAPPIVAEDNTPATNVVTDAGATLGRALFFDRRLSTNQSISCASCHQPSHGFADPRQFSVGYNGSKGTRHAMGLTNARWYQRKHFFWDERAGTLEDQVLMPIQNPIEMGMTLETLTNRLVVEPYYTNLFTRAFGSPAVTSGRISQALAQYVRSIISTKSKYDAGLPAGFANFTAQENLGRQIFFGQVGRATCAICHGTDNFVPTITLNNNGLEFPYVDQGVGGITGNTAQNGLFKVPSLRNVELTAPYMHDGRFATLEQVVAFYNNGIVNGPNLSPPLRGPGGQPLRLNLSIDQQAALVAFLKTLTDTSVTTDAKFSDPFNYGAN